MKFDLGEEWFSNQRILSKILKKHFKTFDQKLRFAEVGSWKGRSAVWFLENFLTHPESVLYCIDTWDIEKWNDFNQEKVLLKTNLKRAEELKVDTIYDQFIFNLTYKGLFNKVIVLRDRSTDALSSMDDEILDFIYIDGDHSEEGCYSDLTGSWPKLKKGALLAGDDWAWKDEGVFPVQKAVKRFAAEKNLKVKPLLFHGNSYYFIKPL